MSRDQGRAGTLLSILWFSFMLAACRSGPGQAAQIRQTPLTATVVASVTRTDPAPTPTPILATAKAPQPPTPRPTSTPRPTPTAAVPTATPTATATATAVACDDRVPPDDELLTLVTRRYGLSRAYEPGDLVALSDFFPNTVTLGYPTEVRRVIVEPLQEIIGAMQAKGLRPQIISGYRSYSAQTLALQKWLEQYPDWADRLSAPPGHSEHQLGTTVDFGSPELAEMLDEAFIQFHPAFDQTSEGQWLHDHAHEYGFVMSYPEDGFERTEFYYEPWHFRYVGPELAARLHNEELTVSEHLSETRTVPCIP